MHNYIATTGTGSLSVRLADYCCFFRPFVSSPRHRLMIEMLLNMSKALLFHFIDVYFCLYVGGNNSTVSVFLTSAVCSSVFSRPSLLLNSSDQIMKVFI